MPALWTYIRLFISKITSDVNLHIFTKHIRCSGQMPLSIIIRLSKEEDGEGDDENESHGQNFYGFDDDEELLPLPFIEALSSCSDRWEVLIVILRKGSGRIFVVVLSLLGHSDLENTAPSLLGLDIIRLCHTTVTSRNNVRFCSKQTAPDLCQPEECDTRTPRY
ncbi:hypothetical protein CPB84DRAFT_875285 [Gymnopilus junonius]|uniref:Uncharacterized protein n=1 Tax=Gymnopilus junonius TaxID=109634 RepID=A0A9P5TN53_GYMJU|nr:hypothetical protein CPB84DRAFT_875285 [Gymnopilus junonius]